MDRFKIGEITVLGELSSTVAFLVKNLVSFVRKVSELSGPDPTPPSLPGVSFSFSSSGWEEFFLLKPNKFMMELRFFGVGVPGVFFIELSDFWRRRLCCLWGGMALFWSSVFMAWAGGGSMFDRRVDWRSSLLVLGGSVNSSMGGGVKEGGGGIKSIRSGF